MKQISKLIKMTPAQVTARLTKYERLWSKMENPEEAATAPMKSASVDTSWITSKETLQAMAAMNLAKRARIISDKFGIKMKTAHLRKIYASAKIRKKKIRRRLPTR